MQSSSTVLYLHLISLAQTDNLLEPQQRALQGFVFQVANVLAQRCLIHTAVLVKPTEVGLSNLGAAHTCGQQNLLL